MAIDQIEIIPLSNVVTSFFHDSLPRFFIAQVAVCPSFIGVNN